jgi:hypothetical protein
MAAKFDMIAVALIRLVGCLASASMASTAGLMVGHTFAASSCDTASG